MVKGLSGCAFSSLSGCVFLSVEHLHSGSPAQVSAHTAPPGYQPASSRLRRNGDGERLDMEIIPKSLEPG